ncbi:MAG: hypothetical protein KDA78_19135 [Planctomycetaceae bacterium]|nr:hypothetical protein [Planctomycetaceae bacterium]
MIGKALFLIALIVAAMLQLADLEREYRQLQALRTRQVYQKQILLADQTRLRLALQQKTSVVGLTHHERH